MTARDFIVLDLTLVDLVGRDAAQLWERIRWRSEDRPWVATYDDLAAETRMSRSLITRAVKVLRNAGLVESRNAFEAGRTQAWWALPHEDPTVQSDGSNGSNRTVPPMENLRTQLQPPDAHASPPIEEQQMDGPAEPEFSLISEDDAPPTEPPKNGRTLVARWIDGHRSTGEADPPGPYMKRVAGQCGRLAKDCATEDDWRVALIACYRAGEIGRVDPVPLMVKARSQFEQRRNYAAESLQGKIAAGDHDATQSARTLAAFLTPKSQREIGA